MAQPNQSRDIHVLDQMCLIAVPAVFSAICLSLCVWQRPMLNLETGSAFIGLLFIGGAFLFLLVLVHVSARGLSLIFGGPDEQVRPWAPWRYVILLLPIGLFALGLPHESQSNVHAESPDAIPVSPRFLREAALNADNRN
ncbi:MAG: hypothetical protein L0219_18365, partial [Phycisphaerales bacterium]|nr:hypothetical protein [Phycisphaerales bacterium]